jgi:hypothetical protein
MGLLGIAQTDNVTPLIEGATQFIITRLSSQFGHQVWWNVVETLAQNGELGRGWKYFAFHGPAVWQVSAKLPTIFFNFLWDGSECWSLPDFSIQFRRITFHALRHPRPLACYDCLRF